MEVRWVCAGFFCVAAALAEPDEINKAFMQMMTVSMTRMDRGMGQASMTGNVDHDFATMMIPHHEGAIDMAKAELSFGKDPVMRRLAQEIIVDQQSEIDAMKLRLTKSALSNGKEK